MPDLHITRDGVLRIRLGAHQEHHVNHVARATELTKVSADVIQLAAHEEDPAPQQDMSEGDASDSINFYSEPKASRSHGSSMTLHEYSWSSFQLANRA